ncbi:MAG: hypothetical protein N2486_07835 [Caloramator sp.]|nr:hypothetical protein [Caloramator sp.]
MNFNSIFYENFKPTEIRLLPLNDKLKGALFGMDIFTIQQKFILDELKLKKKGAFRYIYQGIRASNETLALFQCEGYVIGMGVIEEVVKYDEKQEDLYNGEIRFIPESLITFYPISLEELNRFWPDLKGLSRAKQHLDASKFYQFYLFLQTRHLFY